MNPIQSKSLPALAAALAAAVLTTIPARGAPWTPADLPQPPALWLDASDLSASPVSAWNDKSGNSRNFAQATGAHQPAYSATSFNTSYPGVTFDGSSDFMSAGDTLDMGTNSLTVMSAVRYATSNNSGTIIAKTRYAGGAGRWTLYRTLTGSTFGSGTQYDTVLQPDFLPGAILQVANSSTSARINGFVLDRSTSGSCKIWDNGSNTASATFTGNTTDFNNTDQLWLGAFQNPSGTTPPTAGSYLNGVIAEVVVVQTAMSDTDRQKLEGYLAWKWGMQANLPVGHPYESAAPESSDTTPPTIATLNPTDEATGVLTYANLSATFNEGIQKGTGNITLKKTADNSEVETFDVATSPRITVSGATLTIDPTANLAFATGYYVQIAPAAIQDLSGNSFAGIADSTTWNFTTTSSIPVLNPSFQTPVLGDNADAVGAPTGWTATSPGGFSTWNPPDTIFAGAAGNGTPTGADGSQIYNFYHNAGASARLYQNTTAPLTAGMTYTLTVAIGARLTGNAVDVWGIDLMTTGQALGGTPEAAVYLARTTGGRADLTSGQFVDKTVQFTVPAGHPNLGQNVRVHCWSKAAAIGETIAFDNVRLGISAATPTPYDTWANGTYSPALTAKLPTDNQDGDSLNNLQEFAFGTQPTVSTGEIVYSGGTLTTPGAPKIVAAAGTYSMVFGRRADYVAAGLTYTVQFSAGLDAWVDNDDGTNPPVQVATDGTINAMSVPFVDFITTPSGTQKPTFSRVKVVQAP